MKKPVKLFFDECVSPRLPRILKQQHPHLKTTHLTEHYKSGIKDSEWIPRLAKESWVVITADAGIGSGHGKLPYLCAKYKITHLLITPPLHHLGYEHYKQAIISVLPQITLLPLLPKGTKVLLGFRTVRGKRHPDPHLSIDGRSFNAWCREHGVSENE